MLRSMRPLGLSLAFSLALLGSQRSAHADTAAAQALFDQGKKLVAAGKYAEACPKFAESQKLDPGIGTKYNLADCYEHIGKLATAWGLFLEVAAEAKADDQAEREKVARGRANALKPKLPYLSITVEDPAIAGLQIKRDDVDVGQAQWGTPIPVDPGEHMIVATAPGRKTWETTAKTNKAGATETVEVPQLEEGARVPSVPPPGYYPPPPPGVGGPQMKRKSKGMMAGGIVMISLGTITSLVGGALWGLCNAGGSSCNANGTLAGVTLVGLGALGGGIALTVIGAKKVPVRQPQNAWLAPEVMVGPTSATLRWTY